MTRFTHIHSSGRFDRSTALNRKDNESFHKIAELVTHTEMSADRMTDAFRLPGWSFAHDNRGGGRDECVVEWDNEAFSLGGMPRTEQLSKMRFTRSKEYGGKTADPFFALVVPLQVADHPGQRVWVIVAHMPLDNTALRARIWFDTCRGLRKVVRALRKEDPGAEVLIVADWNKNYRQAEERAKMEKKVARPLGLRQSWAGHAPASGGTHGPKALIDGDVTDLVPTGARLLEDTAASDHRPYAVDYRFPTGKTPAAG